MSAPAPILLLGAGGQVGSALVRPLARLGEVRCASRADADLEQPEQVRRLVRQVAPRLLVNAAAYTAVDAAERDQERCLRVNADAPRVMAEETARLGVPLVHFSTNYVFDGASTEPYRETDPVSPLGVYGRTKALGESAVAAANPDHLILRTSAVYGWTGHNFLLRILAMASEREELRVVNDQFVAPTAASTVADATVAALAGVLTDRGRPRFGTYHVTCTGATSWHGFAERIVALDPRPDRRRLKRLLPSATSDFPAAARRPRNGLLDTDAFTRTFGYAPPSWDDDLRRTMTAAPAGV